MKPLRQNRMPENWTWLRWLFIGCSFLCHVMMFIGVYGLQTTAKSDFNAGHYFDSIFRGQMAFGAGMGIISLSVFVFGEIAVPRILKKRANADQALAGTALQTPAPEM